VRKHLSTPWNIFYVPWTAISSGRRVGVNFSLLWIKCRPLEKKIDVSNME